MKTIITILTEYTKTPLYYSLKPFFDYKGADFSFKFTKSIDYCLFKDNNQYLIMLRDVHKHSKLSFDETMIKLKEKYKKIIYFDDRDSARIERIEFLKYVDLYLKKQLYKDRSVYLKEAYSHRTFESYYHQKLNRLEDRMVEPNISEADISKLKVAWNLGAGTYPQRLIFMRLGEVIANLISPKFGFKIGSAFSKIKIHPKLPKVHAIFSIHKHAYIDYQREVIRETFKNDSNVYQSKVRYKEFYRLMAHSLITMSPFGWGEICYREFEAFLFQSLVIKPNMDHLETFPNVFIKDKTYISLDWDLSNLKEITEYYLNHPEEAHKIVGHAYKHYLKELDKTKDKLKDILILFKS